MCFTDTSFLCSLNIPPLLTCSSFQFIPERSFYTFGCWALFALSGVFSLITLWWQRNDFWTLISPGFLLTWLPDGFASGRHWWECGRARQKILEPFFSPVSCFGVSLAGAVSPPPPTGQACSISSFHGLTSAQHQLHSSSPWPSHLGYKND